MPKRSRTGSISSIGSSSSSSPSGPPSKYTHTSTPEPEPVMQCILPPHAVLSFPTYAAYEIHYEQTHRNRCSECWKNFPTEHFLDLHIGEHHDPLNEARRAKGEKTVCALPYPHMRVSLQVGKSQTDKMTTVSLLRRRLQEDLFQSPETPLTSHRQAHVPQSTQDPVFRATSYQ